MEQIEQARQAALAGLSNWAQAEADLPYAETEATAHARLLAISPGPAGMQLQIASDGLTLDRKLAIERAIRAAAGSESTSIYFRRAQPGTTASAGPVPVGKPASPFGLKFDRRAIPGVREVIVVASGKGGVGKSTVAVNLAAALAARGAKVGLLDADVYGPSAPHMLGLTGGLDVTADDRLLPREAYGIKTVSFGFLTDVRQPVIWRGPLVTKALRQLCYDVVWGELSHLIVDLPPGTGDVQLTLIESLPIHGAVIVTTPQDVALIDAHKALTMFEKLDVPVLGLVENMAHFCCPNCGHVAPIFGDAGGLRMAADRRLPVLAQIPLEPTVRLGGDAGKPAVLDSNSPVHAPFVKLADQILS